MNTEHRRKRWERRRAREGIPRFSVPCAAPCSRSELDTALGSAAPLESRRCPRRSCWSTIHRPFDRAGHTGFTASFRIAPAVGRGRGRRTERHDSREGGARRAETPARPHRCSSSEARPGAPGARRRWQRSFRCQRRAKPGPERSGGTRPTPAASFPELRPATGDHVDRCGVDGVTRDDVSGEIPLFRAAPSPSYASVQPARRVLHKLARCS
jgi:hypothetical protein